VVGDKEHASNMRLVLKEVINLNRELSLNLILSVTEVGRFMLPP